MPTLMRSLGADGETDCCEVCREGSSCEPRPAIHSVMVGDSHGLQWLRRLYVGEQIAELLRREFFQKPLGHQRNIGLVKIIDFVSEYFCALVVGVDDGDGGGVLFGHDAGEDAAGGGVDDVVHELAADDGAGVDDVAEEGG